MPVQIGAKPESGFDDPIGLLTDCHRRIEMFLDVLGKVCADVRGGALTAEQRASAESALRYFRESAPKHTADEERSLFPRLRSHQEPRVKAVMDSVDSLEAQHVVANDRHAEIDRLFTSWLADGTLPVTDASRLSSLLAELSELYRAHIVVEESQVFPTAAAVLNADELRQMGREMAGLRGLS